MTRFARFLPLLTVLATTPGWTQMQDNQERTLTCDDRNHGNHDRLTRHCEIQEQTFAAPKGAMQIDPGTNGGMTVKGWSRNDVLVRARIETGALSDGEARSMVSQIRYASGAGQIKAEGPTGDHDHNWSVTYEIFVPHQTDLTGHTHNGGVRIQDVKGHIEFTAVNGGAHLARLAGDVSGHTTNGGLNIELAGDRWDGKGMDVNTTNGGVKLMMPANYSAHVETSTVNGGLQVDFPVAVQGKLTHDMSFNVGSGGATIRAVTTNGGVKIQKS
jgi:hypothetical protein